MKILQVIPYFYPAWSFGGPVRVVYDISRKLVERGHSVSVYTSDIIDENSRVDCAFRKVDGMDVFYFKNLSLSAAKRKLFITPSLVSALRDNIRSFDVVHVHGTRTPEKPVLHYFLKKNSVPYIVQTHGGLPIVGSLKTMKKAYDFLFFYKFLADASKVIALTQTEAQQFRSIGVPNEKIEVIPNGIDLSEYTDLPPKGSFKKKVGLGDGEKIVLYLGRIHKIKGIDILVKAFAQVVEKLADVWLVIVGPDDGCLGEIQTLTKALKLENKVLILGPLYGKNKLEVYVDADVCVLPSRYETFPTSILETFACSKPILASSVQSIPEIVNHGRTGLLFEPENVKELSEELLFVLNHPHEAEKMGTEAQKMVKDYYSMRTVADQFEDLYADLTNT